MGLPGAIVDETPYYPPPAMTSYIELSPQQQRDILEELKMACLP